MLIRNKKVLLLDEITSALDSKTADNIRQLLFSLPLTVIEVAHNYNYENYDKIIYLAQKSEYLVSVES
jgi:ATP-binding cassette subfamily C protein